MEKISFDNLIELLNLIFKIEFTDSNIERLNDGILITIKIKDCSFLKINVSESESVFTYHTNKKMTSNGYGNLKEISENIISLGIRDKWVKN